jgi:acyl carrier protein
MNKEQPIAELKALIKPYVANIEALEVLTEDTDFIADLKINSANLVDVVLDIEEKYDIIIDNESMEKMLTVKAAMAIIEDKLASRN